MNSDLRAMRVESCPPHPMNYHDLARLFPLLDKAAADELMADIRVNGVREPIVIYEGHILDGRNRYHAARELGVTYPVAEYVGADPLGYVISLNLRRRHLTESQRAIVAAKLAKLPAHRPEKGADLHPSAAAAGQMLNVSERSVKSAQAVVRTGSPALVQSVETGHVSVSAAAEVARLPESEQAEIVAQGPEVVAAVAAVQRQPLTRDEKAELRAGLIAAAEQGLKGRGSRSANRNPLHEPNPAYDAALAVAGSCTKITETIATYGIPFVLGGILNDGMRERTFAKVEAARDTLTDILEAFDAQRSAA